MAAAGFLFENNDPADPFLRTNMKYGICRHCELFGECPQSDAMPIMSTVSSYIYKYYAEHSRGFNVYPEPGGWEAQPVWFIDLLDKLRGKMSSLEQKKREQNGNK